MVLEKLQTRQFEKTVSLYPAQALNAGTQACSKRKHAARLSLKAKQGDEFFTLQMVCRHQVVGGTSVRQNSTVELYIQMLGVQIYSTISGHLTEQRTAPTPSIVTS